ncbi:MAG: hypothetical protein MI824_09970 [Hyphomicrobiales bacterium]|nr:hypothetical protein [Hyphomicrobiales bacterium]
MSGRLYICLAAVVFLALNVVGNALHQKEWLKVQDDQMYLLFLSLRYDDPERAERLANLGHSAIEKRAENSRLIERSRLRWLYRDNYVGHLYLVYAGTLATASVIGGQVDATFSETVAWGMSLGMLTASLLAGLLVVFALLRAADPLLALAVAIVAVIACYQSFIDLGASHKIFGNVAEGQSFIFFRTISQIFLIILDPGKSTFLFGATPRSVFVLVLLAMFVLRWKSHFSLSYLMFFPMILFHQSQAGLFLFGIVVLDLVLRPTVLLRPFNIGAIGLVAAVFFWRERLWEVVGAGLGPVEIGLIMLLPALALIRRIRVAVVMGYRNVSAMLRLRFLDRFLVWLREQDIVVSDLVMLSLGWLGFLMLTWAGNQFATAVQSDFFWNHIAGRVLGLIHPIVLTAICYLLLRHLAARQSAKSVLTWGVSTACLLSVPVVALNLPNALISDVVSRNIEKMRQLEHRAERDPIEVYRGQDEVRYYHALAKTMATDKDLLKGLWK